MAEGSGERRPRGRPSVPAEKAKRYPLAIRTTKRLKDLLQHAADSSGRSLAQEVEFRLELSLQADEINEHGDGPLAIVEMVARAMLKAGEGARYLSSSGRAPFGGDWADDAYAFDQAFQAAILVLEALRPDGPTEPTGYALGLEQVEPGSGKQGGRLTAASIIEAVANPGPGEIGRWAQSPREMLSAASLERLKAAAESIREETV
jgi:hypothetical protein